MAVGDEVYDRETGVVYEIIWDGSVRTLPRQTDEVRRQINGASDMVKLGGHRMQQRYGGVKTRSRAHQGPR